MTAARLRALLEAPGLVTVPGCFDALGARLVEQAGFEAAYMTGFGTSATLLAQPDIGLVGRDDMVATVARIAAATTLSLIADADTGFGDADDTAATVRDYERVGASAIQLEDQVSPKRCGHMTDKSVVPVDEMVAKLEAAVAARREMLVVARTDARAPEGLGAAIERAHRYVEAGADVLFVEALESIGEFEQVAREPFGVPLVYNRVEGGRSPLLGAGAIEQLGYKILLMPISLLLSATRAMQATLTDIRTHGATDDTAFGPDPFNRFNDIVGFQPER